MFENMTFENIMESLTANIDPSLDTEEGSVLYDALAPCAIELANLYIQLDTVLNQTFVDTATGGYLDLRCGEKGIKRKEATYAVVKGVFEPSNIELLNQRFTCGSYSYKAYHKEEDGVYLLKCESSGSAPNSTVGTLIPINFIEGLQTATITEISIPGEDEETDEELREKYFTNLESIAFGGNIADYRAKIESLDGVGATKIIPVWNGGGTVKALLLDSEFKAASNNLINYVQEIMDPLQDGNGTGMVPVGHKLTVAAAKNKAINISYSITYEGSEQSVIDAAVKAAVEKYFKSLAKLWADSNTITVSYMGIASAIYSVAGVKDLSALSVNSVNNINNGVQSVELSYDEIPVIGTWTMT